SASSGGFGANSMTRPSLNSCSARLACPKTAGNENDPAPPFLHCDCSAGGGAGSFLQECGTAGAAARASTRARARCSEPQAAELRLLGGGLLILGEDRRGGGQDGTGHQRR